MTETIIEMTPDANGIFQPSHVIKEKDEKRKKDKQQNNNLHKQKQLEIEKVEVKSMLDEFLEGFSIGNDIINQLRRSIR